jgi:hypothetical protein
MIVNNSNNVRIILYLKNTLNLNKINSVKLNICENK